MRKIRIMVLMGGRTAEHEVSLATGKQVVQNLDPQKYEIAPVVISQDGSQWLLKSLPQLLVDLKIRRRPKRVLATVAPTIALPLGFKPDVVFIAMHGPFGEDGTIQGMLELAGIPYTGAGVLASALGMNKIMFRKIMAQEKIPIPRFLVFNKSDNKAVIPRQFKFPVFIKPYNQGSSAGASICHGPSELKKALELALGYSNPILVEEYLAGKELSVGVLGNKTPVALPVAEIIPKNEFFDYEAKYTPGKSEEIVPARISKKLTLEVQALAVKVFQAIGCRGFGRVDMILKNNRPVVLEINTIPGLTPFSIFPKEAAAAGISYPQLLDRLIELALEK